MNINRCEAIIFDLDGTLYDKKNIAFYTVLKHFTNIKLLKASNKVRKILKGVDFETSSNFYNKFFSEISKTSLIPESEIKKWYFNSFYTSFIKILDKKYRARADINNLLTAISKKIPIALFSDYAKIEERLNVLEIDNENFKIIASSEEYGVLKPSARPLLDIASKLNICAENILVVGDRKDTDGEAANKAKMQFYYIENRESWEIFSDKILQIVGDK